MGDKALHSLYILLVSSNVSTPEIAAVDCRAGTSYGELVCRASLPKRHFFFLLVRPFARIPLSPHVTI